MALDKVLVLLATYNGAEYIEEQLFSILNQQNIKTNIIIFDDGSTDNTMEYIQKMDKLYSGRIHVIQNTDNIHGPLHSFISLINYIKKEQLSRGYEFISFSDQDDIWLPGKLINAVFAIKKFNAKMSISSGISTNLLNYADITTYDRRVYSFGEALLKNNAIGMTMVMKNIFLDKVIFPDNFDMNIWLHDHLLYLIALYQGDKVVFVHEPGVIYRQHTHNVIGDKKNNVVHRIKNKVNYVLKSQVDRKKTAELLRKNYIGTARNIELVNNYLNYDKQNLLSRLKLVKKDRIYSNKRSVKFITKILAAFKIL